MYPLFLEVSPLGRIRPEAREIASRHTKGIIAMILSNEDARQSSFTRKRKNNEKIRTHVNSCFMYNTLIYTHT